MENEIKKENKQLNNFLYKERFQFILQINDNVICQRYFRINGINFDNLESLELKEVMDEAVKLIQNDLASKSRVYEWYTRNAPMKLTGFVDDMEKYTEDERMLILSGTEDRDIFCKNGDVIHKTYYQAPIDEEDPYIDKERPKENEFVFKFSFLFDDKVVYERIWDGNVYHKFVRNSVDLSNSDIMYRDKDPMSLSFNFAIIRHMTLGKVDLIYDIIKRICDTMTATDTYYTKKVEYGSKNDKNARTYHLNKYKRSFINGWRSATEQKTSKYMSTLYPSAGQISYIDKYL